MSGCCKVFVYSSVLKVSNFCSCVAVSAGIKNKGDLWQSEIIHDWRDLESSVLVGMVCWSCHRTVEAKSLPEILFFLCALGMGDLFR